MSANNPPISLIGLFVYRGMLYGAGLGLIGWFIIYPIISPFIVAGAIVGAIAGGITGGICSLIVDLCRRVFFKNIQSERIFLGLMMATTSISAFIIGTLLIGSIHQLYAVVDVSLISNVSLLGGILALCGAIFAGWEAGTRYLQFNEMTSQPASKTKIDA